MMGVPTKQRRVEFVLDMGQKRKLVALMDAQTIQRKEDFAKGISSRLATNPMKKRVLL